MHPSRWSSPALLLCVAVFGCGSRQPAIAQPKSPKVVVSRPVTKEVTDYEDFTGRSESVASVEVRARVSGYLDKARIKDEKREGGEVEEGELLFEIDARTYQAELNRTEAILRQNEARLKRLHRDFGRAVKLLPSQAINQEEYDRIEGDRDEAQAAVEMAKAARDLAQLNFNFTRVAAPIGGRVSRQFVDPGNMVKADDTVLTTIVALDPIYVYFDVDERTMLRVRRLIRAGKVKSVREAAMPVFAGLVDEEAFPHAGTVNFVDNRVDAMSGTLRLRGVFPNPKRLLSPGMFVRVRLPIGNPHSAILITERALGTDQGQPFVYVVNDDDEVVYRRVTVGPWHGGLRVVEEGLAAQERIVVSGLQRIRPKMKVDPELTEMPIVGGASAPPLVTAPDGSSKQ